MFENIKVDELAMTAYRSALWALSAFDKRILEMNIQKKES